MATIKEITKFQDIIKTRVSDALDIDYRPQDHTHVEVKPIKSSPFIPKGIGIKGNLLA